MLWHLPQSQVTRICCDVKSHAFVVIPTHPTQRKLVLSLGPCSQDENPTDKLSPSSLVRALHYQGALPWHFPSYAFSLDFILSGSTPYPETLGAQRLERFPGEIAKLSCVAFHTKSGRSWQLSLCKLQRTLAISMLKWPWAHVPLHTFKKCHLVFGR